MGNIGPEAALPVMEGKALLFKRFAQIDAVPLCLNTQEPNRVIDICCALEANFGGINLEDISAPNCVLVERELEKFLDYFLAVDIINFLNCMVFTQKVVIFFTGLKPEDMHGCV